MLDYQRADCTDSLSEGLAAYYAAYPGLTRGRQLADEAREFFRCHDTVHVLYGCSIALDDELVVKLVSLFGTTAGFDVLRGYRLHESRRIYRQLRPADVLASMAHAVTIVPRTLYRCQQQKARWPWDDHAQYLGTTLQELRSAFGIHVAH